ncbi:MAG: hypothetical protein FWH51_00095 [Dehalococcoidia bacterium]|nr:hypothetical protein [Dehalococcoidia bacterium]
MDEGVAGYMSYIALRESAYKDSVQAWHELQFEIARKALAEGTWVDISGLSEYMRSSNVSYANSAWESKPELALAESYVVASYLAATYGLDKCISTYKGLNDHGGSAESTLVSNIGLTFGQLEVAIRAWLAETA